jgi:asparagine synthase (glutamine-hydrolysing)
MFNRVLPKKIQKILLRSKSSPMKLIIKKDILKHCNTNPLVNIQKSPNSIFNISHNQIYINPLQKYLRWEDRISMAHSIEARVPFLDHHLVEFTRKLPVNLLDSLNYSKKLLRDSLSSILPKEIQERSDKKGFITPEEDWFKNEYHEKFKELLKCNFDYSKGIFDESKILEYFENIKNEKVKFDYSYWRIISFCIWMKVYKVELE